MTDPREEWRRLHAMGYSPQQIQALLTPLPKLPAAQKRSYTELIVWLVVIGVVATCMAVAVFSAVADQAVPGH